MVHKSNQYMNDSHQGGLYLTLGTSNFKLLDFSLYGQVVLIKIRHRTYELEHLAQTNAKKLISITIFGRETAKLKCLFLSDSGRFLPFIF
jgi:hypothetical protein